jgi:hypothetical protein
MVLREQRLETGGDADLPRQQENPVGVALFVTPLKQHWTPCWRNGPADMIGKISIECSGT